MAKTCLKCDYTRTAFDTAPQSECPQCGAIYAKVEQTASHCKMVRRMRPSGFGEDSGAPSITAPSIAEELTLPQPAMLAPDMLIPEPVLRRQALTGASVPRHPATQTQKSRQAVLSLWVVAAAVAGGYWLYEGWEKKNAATVAAATEVRYQVRDAEARARSMQAMAARRDDPVRKAAAAKQAAQIETALEGLNELRRSMKDPDAFVSKGFQTGPNGTVCYEFRAKNSFGAVLPSRAMRTPAEQMLYQDRLGDAAFIPVWNTEC